MKKSKMDSLDVLAFFPVTLTVYALLLPVLFPGLTASVRLGTALLLSVVTGVALFLRRTFANDRDREVEGLREKLRRTQEALSVAQSGNTIEGGKDV